MSVTIANPIYDVVFRYLMEDTQVATTILSTLTGFDIVDLKFRPTEYAIEKQEGRDYTVYRLDFAVRILRQYFDPVTDGVVECQDEFIESLTHDAMVIQVPLLSKKHGSHLEALANIFNQKFRLESDEHVLLVDDDTFPEELKSVLLRLIKAGQEPKIRKIMDVEDEILEELEFKQRSINHLKQKNKEEKSQKEAALRQKNEALRQQKDLIKMAIEALVATVLSAEEAKKKLGLQAVQ